MITDRNHHLEPEVAQILGLPLEERIEYARRDYWVGYGRAREILEYLDDMLTHPKVLRMPGTLIVADTNNGKSRILKRFRELHPPVARSNGEPVMPVLYIMMPSEPSESRFWSTILTVLKFPHRDTDPVQSKENTAYDMLIYCGVKMLVVDELHNVLNGSARAQKHFLAVLKNLSNKLQLPIITAGTRDALRALHVDKQLATRFEAKGIHRWELNKKFQQLLASFERLLPLRNRSELSSPTLARAIYSLGDGTIGSISDLLKKACVVAIRNGDEQISLELLDQIKISRDNDKL